MVDRDSSGEDRENCSAILINGEKEIALGIEVDMGNVLSMREGESVACIPGEDVSKY